MKWLEIIELRIVGSTRKLLESQLQNLVDKVNKTSKHKTIKIYNHSTVETDFSIHIFHDSKKVENSGSQLGQGIAAKILGWYEFQWVDTRHIKQIRLLPRPRIRLSVVVRQGRRPLFQLRIGSWWKLYCLTG